MLSWLFPKKTPSSSFGDQEIQEDFSNIESIADYFKDLTGVTFDKQISILNSKTKSFCLSYGIYSYNELLEKISHDEDLKQDLINRLTTNETFFYREFNQIAELVSLIKQDTHPVRILCAPCATGEESYSIAIALLEAGVPKTKFTIMGIDINSEAIEKAKEGIYRERNVRNLSDEIRQRYFTQHGDMFHLTPEIKSLIEFKIFNIFEENFKKLEKFDYIFSRNMLIYFDMQTKQKAVKILESMRKDQAKKIFFGHADLF
ncbi:CheR family methyltransferase [Sulfurimonas sp. C5]|uniref:CheR family methyltransferase n=1 Tax=Sulfurimonas sp. C5 TaxID=3036947 RepID=UPI002458DDFA|nr:CheR family methyltransferase [Sulfurimonas sp. C5]MDH4944287.1 CheR family methyltransferase [Sulfurimonas sp. C5]